jgi:phosphoribosylaminoimidazolecarboxamide formyltransferase/IMP cyclohydrolase
LINQALISVSDKSGLEKLGRYLHEQEVRIISTGGTYDALKRAGIRAKQISDITASAEILDGRVKTLHPIVHAGILARTDQLGELELRNIKPLDLVVVNLYPFENAVASKVSFDKIIENIDIGGPTMVRAAAKNFERVTIICDPADYPALIDEMEHNRGNTTIEFRKKMAAKAFELIRHYDEAIAKFFSGEKTEDKTKDIFAGEIILSYKKRSSLRYGENPHQQAALYADSAWTGSSLTKAKLLSGKELSFNNIWDLEAALQMILDFKQPFAAVIKHTNPCGAAVADNLAEAYHKALASDPLSAFGSVIGLNRKIDIATARLLHETHFIECILAPDYDPEALELLKRKKQRRLVAVGDLKPPSNLSPEIRVISGGALVQDRDNYDIKPEDLKTVTKTKPDSQQIADLLFGFKLIKHIKSNAILICKDGATAGIGPGQTSRVDSSLIAVRKAGERAKGAVAASDAFFPMPDGLEVLAEAGVKAVIQPGGSKGDPEVIAAADKHGVAMVFTGIRHFKH